MSDFDGATDRARRQKRKRGEKVILRGVWAECKKILDSLKKHKHSWPFLKAVDPVALSVPDYFDVIKHPMDLGTIEETLTHGGYYYPEDFSEDVRLVWSNAAKYNGPNHDVTKMANTLSHIFEKKFQELKKKNFDDDDPDNLEKAVSKRTKEDETVEKLSFEEKRQLCAMINNLETRHLGKVLQIIHQGVPEVIKNANQVNDEELEISVEALDARTLRELEAYAKEVSQSTT